MESIQRGGWAPPMNLHNLMISSYNRLGSKYLLYTLPKETPAKSEPTSGIRKDDLITSSTIDTLHGLCVKSINVGEQIYDSCNRTASGKEIVVQGSSKCLGRIGRSRVDA